MWSFFCVFIMRNWACKFKIFLVSASRQFLHADTFRCPQTLLPFQRGNLLVEESDAFESFDEGKTMQTRPNFQFGKKVRKERFVLN